MILIAHRGNINGPNPEKENDPSYVYDTLDLGFDAEIDVWFKNDEWWLGHDEPTYRTTFAFLNLTGLWIHCKDYITLQQLLQYDNLNVFYHTDEHYVITSKKFIWAYPGKEGNDNTICVMPERNDSNVAGFAGICSDYIGKYK